MTRHFFLFVGSMTVVAFVACSSSSTDTSSSGDGGASSSSGTTSSSSGASSSSGSSGDGATSAIAQAIFQVNGGAAADCSTVPAFSVGDFGGNGAQATPVPNGTKEDGSTVTVQCRVIPDTGGFELFAHIDQAGTSVELTGTIDSSGKTKPGTLLLVGSDTWTSTDCEFTPSGAQQGVAAGRYWATISCPQADSKDGKKCDLFGQVRIENCDSSRN